MASVMEDQWRNFQTGLNNGTMATLDGIIPFVDPYADSGSYDPNDPDLQFSQGAGRVAQTALLTASGVGLWGRLGGATGGVALTSLRTGSHFYATVTQGSRTVYLDGSASMNMGVVSNPRLIALFTNPRNYVGAFNGIPLLYSSTAIATAHAPINCFWGACAVIRRGILDF